MNLGRVSLFSAALAAALKLFWAPYRLITDGEPGSIVHAFLLSPPRVSTRFGIGMDEVTGQVINTKTKTYAELVLGHLLVEVVAAALLAFLVVYAVGWVRRERPEWLGSLARR